MTLAKIHASDIATWKACRRRWEWSSSLHRNLEPAKPYTPFLLGRAVHHALEHYYGSGMLPEESLASFWQEETVKMQVHGALWETEQQIIAEQYELSLGLLEHYLMWLKTIKGPLANDQYETVATELRFEVPLRDPFGTVSDKVMLAGRIDGVCRRKSDGTLWLREFKTARGIQERLNMLPYDEQPIVYIMAATEHYGEPVQGVIYDIIRKKLPAYPKPLANGMLSQAKSQKTSFAYYLHAIRDHHGPAATPEFIRANYGLFLQVLKEEAEPFFDRVVVQRTPEQLELAARDIWVVAHEMVDPTMYVFPSSGYHCNYCSFKVPCALKNYAMDYEAVLAAEYRPRSDNPEEVLVEEVASEAS
jgi:hypothetical protein